MVLETILSIPDTKLSPEILFSKVCSSCLRHLSPRVKEIPPGSCALQDTVPGHGVVEDGLNLRLDHGALVDGGGPLDGGELHGQDPVEGGDGDQHGVHGVALALLQHARHLALVKQLPASEVTASISKSMKLRTMASLWLEAGDSSCLLCVEATVLDSWMKVESW